MTTKVKVSHTPAPWVWGNYCEDVQPGAEDCCELVSYGPWDEKKESRPIIDILHLADDCSINEANARLIAAAPELLQRLKDVLEDAMAPVNTLAMRRAEALIAKVEGDEGYVEAVRCELCGTIANVQVLANGARICAECREALREAK